MNRYLNLDLELYDHRREGDAETLRSRVLAAPVGAQREAEAELASFPRRLRPELRRLERRELEVEGLIALGERLASLMLPGSIRRILAENLRRLDDATGLRIRLRTDTPELAEIPWEYAYLAPPETPPGRKGPEGFLVLDRRISLVRFEVLESAETPLRPLRRDEVRMVALLSEVDDPAWAELDLDREELNLRHALDGVDGIDARYLRPGTLDQLEEAVVEDAEVFHFSGHGEMERRMGETPGTFEGRGRLILTGDDRRPAPLEASSLAAELRGRGVRLAVLAACEAARRDPVTPWSGVAAALVRDGLPAVVAMQYTVRDGSAIAFSRRFYRSLAAGRSIDTAVSDGRLGVLHRGGGGERDWGVPVLYLRSDRSVLFPPPLAPYRRNLALAVAAVLLLTLWFALHLYPLAGELASGWAARLGLGAGAIAVLAGAGRYLGSFLARSVRREESGPVTERWLRHKRAARVLIPVLSLVALLFVSTSSLYLSHDDESIERVDLGVETAAGYPFAALPELVTTSDEGERLAGGPIFGWPPPRELAVRVKSPAGWELTRERVRPRPWRRVALSAERDLSKVELRVIRLAPHPSLASLIPEPDGEPLRRLNLEVEIDGEPLPPLEDLRRGLVYLGAAEELLRSQVAKESIDRRRASIMACLDPPLPPLVAAMMGAWGPEDEKRRHYLGTPSLTGDEEVVLRIVIAETGETVSSKSLLASELPTDSIETVCLGRN